MDWKVVCKIEALFVPNNIISLQGYMKTFVVRRLYFEYLKHFCPFSEKDIHQKGLVKYLRQHQFYIATPPLATMPFSSIIKLPSIDNTSSATHTHQKGIFQHFFVGISPSYISQSPLLEYICQKYKGRPYKRYEKQNTKKDYSILDKSSEMVPHVHKMIINFLVLIHLFCSSSSKPFCMEFTSEEVLQKLKNIRFKCEASIFFGKKH